jgi:hypothetical protein
MSSSAITRAASGSGTSARLTEPTHGSPTTDRGGASSGWLGSGGVERKSASSSTERTRHRSGDSMTPGRLGGNPGRTGVRPSSDGTGTTVAPGRVFPVSSGRTVESAGWLTARSSSAANQGSPWGAQAVLDLRLVKHGQANAVTAPELRVFPHGIFRPSKSPATTVDDHEGARQTFDARRRDV